MAALTQGRRIALWIGVPSLLIIVVLGLLSLAQLVLRTSDERTLSVATASRLVVDDAVGRVVVRAGDGPGVQVRSAERWTWSRPQVSAELDGGTARVDARCRRPVFIDSCAVDLEVRVPADVATTIRASSGKVTSPACRLGGRDVVGRRGRAEPAVRLGRRPVERRWCDG